ncbi:hypothetical protein EDD15DRAFT_964623 [Pisolithus albus]|nr:hypothetical protein EDD15DRAFT_964623 [Pisolithus albus]
MGYGYAWLKSTHLSFLFGMTSCGLVDPAKKGARRRPPIQCHCPFKVPDETVLYRAAREPQVVVTPSDHSQRKSAYILPNAINSVRPPDDTRNVHTSDGEHAGCCIVCGFKLL